MGALQCLMQAFSTQPSWTPSVPHECNTQCPILMHHDYAICCWSGNFHKCGDMCDRLEDQLDCKVCPVTAMSVKLEFKATFEQGAGREEWNRTVGQAEPQRKRKFDDLAVSQRNAGITKGAKKAKKKHPIVNAAETYHIILNIVQDEMKSLSAQRQSELTVQIHECHNKIKTTSLYHLNPTFTIDKHTCVCLWFMARGGDRWLEHDFVVCHPDVKEHWVPLEKRTSGIVVGMRKMWRKTTLLFSSFKVAYINALLE